MTKTLQAIKWHGGKYYLANKIIQSMPLHIHYVEPYFGGGAVLLAKGAEGVSEVANDIHAELTNFWSVLQDAALFEQFIRTASAIPFSEAQWNLSHRPTADRVQAAVNFFVRGRKSRARQMRDFAPLSRTRTRRGMNEQASAWLSAVEGLPEVHRRLKRVAVLNRDALEVIRTQDGKDTLFYLDPPYVHTTRTSPDIYQHEMSNDDHRRLLEVLANATGKFLLSGYRCDRYDEAAHRHGWHRCDFTVPNNAAGGKSQRQMTESVWANCALPGSTE
ncbi:MAG: DNA adenine methylase [Pirellulales bacterium]